VTFQQHGDLSVEVTEVRATRQAARVAARPAPWLFASAMAASMAIAAGGGLVLGIFAATNTGIARQRWTEVVQAHGHLQLFGWVAVFVVALAFEFIIRLNQRSPLAAGPRAGVFALLAAGAIVTAAGPVFGEAERITGIAGAGLLLVGAAGFAWMIGRVPAARPLEMDMHPLFFRAGAAWLVVSAAALLAAFARTDLPFIPLDESNVVVETALRGFVLSLIVGVGLRAFPGHLEVAPMRLRSQRLVFVGIHGSTLLWVAGTSGFGLRGSADVQRVADLLFAATLLFVTWEFGIAGVVGRWSRASERYQVLVPVAWLGLVAYSAGLAAMAIYVWAGGAPNLYQTGAVRHTFLLGFMGPLMVAMAHIVLARFGTGHLIGERWLTAGFVLLVVAWPLRVAPPLLDPDAGRVAEAVMGAAGGLAIVGLALAAGGAAWNARAVRAAWDSAAASD
jgi:uncharacterized protein involved in response to NO